MNSPLGASEIELYISTENAVPAERGLSLAHAFIAIVREHDDIGPDTFIEIVHLGAGSFSIRLRLLTAAGAALVAQAAVDAVVGNVVDNLMKGLPGFSEEIAKTHIETGADQCSISTTNIPRQVFNLEMPAFVRHSTFFEGAADASADHVSKFRRRTSLPKVHAVGHFEMSGVEPGKLLFRSASGLTIPVEMMLVSSPTMGQRYLARFRPIYDVSAEEPTVTLHLVSLDSPEHAESVQTRSSYREEIAILGRFYPSYIFEDVGGEQFYAEFNIDNYEFKADSSLYFAVGKIIAPPRPDRETSFRITAIARVRD